ncbi:MAG: hypothetical protein J6R38_03190 [Alistipes sp.]|nr:hypothetical protein [Alistipes sp.]
MRKLISLFSLAILFFMVGCEKNIENEQKGMTFTFTEVDATTTSLEIIVTPSDATANYYVAFSDSASLVGKDSATLINEMIAGTIPAEVVQGPKNIVKSSLAPNTEYAILAFGYGDTTVTRHNAKTMKSAGILDHNSFEVNIEVSNVTANSAVAKATPNGSENRYLFRILTAYELNAFGIYDNDLEIFKYIIENPSSNDYIYTGTTTLNWATASETKYLAVAFNVESYQQVLDGEVEVRLFRKEFETPRGEQVDPNTLFTVSNLTVDYDDFTLDVTPMKGDSALWTYYIWTKESYDYTLNNEAQANIVMRSYWGLNNIGVEHGFDFGTFIKEYMGQTGSSQILAYQPLKNDTEYVVVLFYMDPEVSDPTVVYDYNYVAVEFKTLAPSSDEYAKLEVTGPAIEVNGFKYNVLFNVKTDEKAVDIKVGAQLWANYDFAKYWDEADWSQIQAFFLFRTSVSAESLAAAKTADGATIAFNDVDKDDYVFFFEVLNKNNTPTQYAIRVTPEMFE